MPTLDAELAKSERCQNALRTMMWAFLFFVPFPIPVPGFEFYPDLGGWLLILLAVSRLIKMHPAMEYLRLLTASGIALWIIRAVVFHVGTSGAEKAHFLFYLTTWAVIILFVWKLCDILREIAAAFGSEALAAQARSRRWASAVPFFAMALVASIGPKTGPLSLVTLYGMILLSVVSISLLMGLLAHAERACALQQLAERKPPDSSDEPKA